jgi:hypothetical protein
VEMMVVGAKDRRHERRVGNPEVEQARRRGEHFAGHPVEPHVAQVLVGVGATPRDVLEARSAGDRSGASKRTPGLDRSPMPDSTCPCSTTIASAPSTRPMRGARSRNTASMRVVQRSGGSKT